MKKTQFIDLITTIKRTIIVFLSITLFVALSVGCYVGIKWSGGSIKNAIDEALELANAHDAEILFTYQFDEEDLDKIKAIDGVDEIEGTRYTFCQFDLNDKEYQAKIMQLTTKIDIPIYIEGEVPSKENECMIDTQAATNLGISIGDKITFTNNDDNTSRLLTKIVNYHDGDDIQAMLDNEVTYYNDYLVTDTFVVTGICTNSANIADDGAGYGVSSTNMQNVDCLLYVAESAFDPSSLEGYTTILVRSDALRGLSTYSDEYRNLANELQDKIKPVVNAIAKEKCSLIHKSADLLSINADTLLKESKQKIDDGQAQVESAEKKLENAEKLLNVSRTTLNQVDKLDTAKVVEVYNNANYGINKLLDKAEDDEELVEAYKSFKSRGIVNNLRLVCSFLGLDKAVTTIDTIDSNIRYMASEATVANQIRDLLAQTQTIKDEMNANYAGLSGVELLEKIKEDAWSEYYSYRYQYNQGVEQLNDAKLQLEEANKLYSYGIEYLDNLNESKDSIPDYEGNILLRKYNTSVYFSVSISNILNKLCLSMASLFVLVGLLVCYSAISRIVNDQMKIIGTKKALGLLQPEITKAYLSYTGAAVALGCLLGLTVGVFMVETIIIDTFSKVFMIKTFKYYIDWVNYAIMCAIELVSLLCVTYFSCLKIFKQNAIRLLAGPEPPVGKERFYEKNKTWQKLSLLTKTIVNNCINDKRRVIGTLIGIAGSCALLVTSFTMNNNVVDSFTTQYSKIFHFDEFICFEGGQETSDEIEALLDKYEVRHAEVMRTKLGVKLPDGDYIYSNVFVETNPDDLKQLLTFYEEGEVNEDYTGTWMCNSYCDYYDTGDNPIDFVSVNGNECLVNVTGYFDSYLTQYTTFMSKKDYESSFNETVTPNAYMINSADCNMKVLMKDLVNVEGYTKIVTYKSDTQEAFDTFASVSKTMVMIYSLLAAIMAFLVLLNLLTMFVDEKQKELIVLMINGFYIKDARRYIYSDTILLTFIGIILGLIIGTITGNASVASFQTAASKFLEKIDLKACLIGVGGSLFLTFVVSCIALRKIKKFKLTDINK